MNRWSKRPASPLSAALVAQLQLLTLTALVMISMSDTSAAGTLFECIDAQGQTLFTDSPRPPLACQALDFSLKTSPVSTASASAASTKDSAPNTRRVRPSTPASGDPQSAAVPVERLGNILVVTATLNGSKQARLIVDTGASQTIISQRLASELGLYSIGHTTHVLLHTASGSVQADAVILESIQIGGAEIRNSHILIHDLPDLAFAVDGLLGLNFLGAYQITIDIGRGELHLKSPPERLGEPGGTK